MVHKRAKNLVPLLYECVLFLGQILSRGGGRGGMRIVAVRKLEEESHFQVLKSNKTGCLVEDGKGPGRIPVGGVGDGAWGMRIERGLTPDRCWSKSCR